MATPSVLTFDGVGHLVDFESWLEDVHWYLHSFTWEDVSLFKHTSGSLDALVDSAAHVDWSKWTSRDATAALAVRRLALPFLFPELSDFTTVADLLTHLHSLETCYASALKPAFREAESAALAVATSCRTPLPSVFEGCSPSLLAPCVAFAAAVDFLGAEEVGVASAPSGRRRSGKGKVARTLLWHHHLGHPSLLRLRGMHSRLLVSGLPKSLPPLPPSPAPPCLPCVEGRQRNAPHSSSFPPDDCSSVDTPHGREFCRGEGILQSFTLLDSPQQNGIAERHTSLVMEVAHTSMIHAAAPHFLWLFAVRYAAHQLNLWPRVSLPETSPTLRWTRKVGVVSVFRVWGSRAFVHDTFADKLSAHAIPCVFLGFSPDAPGWRFYHPTSRRVFPSQDVTFDESVPLYRLFPFRSAPPPSPPLFLAPIPPPVDPLPPQGPAPSGVSQVDPLPGTAPVEVAVGSGAAPRAASGGAASGGAEHGGAEPEGAGSGEPGGTASEGAESGGAEPRGGVSTARDTGAGGAGVPARAGCTGAAGPRGARTRGTGAAVSGGVGGAGAGDPTEPGAAGAGGASAVGAGAGGTGAGGAGAGGAGAQVLGVPSSPEQSQPPSQPASPLPAPSPYTEKKGGPTERREPASHPASPIHTGRLHFAAACRLNYATALVAESESASPPSVGGECALGTDVLEDRQEDFECLAAAVPRFASMLLALKGDPDAPDIPTPRSYTEAIDGPYSSQWQAAMDAEMASRKTTGTYVDTVPPSRANIVDGMWIFRVKRPPGSPPAFKARYVARGFSQRQGG
ncbi:unnamed protein product [Closterium sp. NIES-53]